MAAPVIEGIAVTTTEIVCVFVGSETDATVIVALPLADAVKVALVGV